MTNWRFYGRQEELERLTRLLSSRLFCTHSVSGRRGVGKASLLREVAARRRGDPPLVHCELPEPVDGGSEALAEILARAVEVAGLAGLHARLLPTLKRRLPQFRFCEMVGRLIESGVIVALDEFHHARKLGLESQIKLMIDTFRFAKRVSSVNPQRCGKLFLLGSHQQQMLRMFLSDRPLHLRVDSGSSLRQWRIPTVLEMAAEQRLLDRPGRFLTLWTAFGGMPGHWERFATHDEWAKLRDFDALDDDRAWRAAFIEAELNHLESVPEDRYDNRAFVELTPEGRQILLHLGRGRRRGCTIGEFPPEMSKRAEQTLEDSLDVLEGHLELVGPVWEFLGPTKRWRVIDNNTQFQIDVMPAGRGKSRRTGLDDPDGVSWQELALRRLETHEGAALEKLTTAWLVEAPGVNWARQGVWLPGVPDIDAMAFAGKGKDRKLLLASCKRNAGKHDPAKQRQQFEEFMAALDVAGKRERADAIRGMPRRLMLVSPTFTAADRERLAIAGFECVGIRDMARSLGIEADC
ncbi:MAG: ATP-binding protein [Rhodobacteraceae bacterium]|nr:ATP-binding protein [Paracoccaceae bacterium]